jgi:Rrf2 family protein
MLKLTKKVDYALIALMHLAHREVDEPAASAREIAAAYGMPPDLLAKVLQRLAHAELVRSHQGTKGGYELGRPSNEITVVDVVSAIDGPPVMVQCVTEVGTCEQFETCNVKTPLQRLTDDVVEMLSRVTIESMCASGLSSLADGVPAPSEASEEVLLPVLRAN